MDDKFKTCGNCKYNSDYCNVVESKCYSCRSNPVDNRIDYFCENDDPDPCDVKGCSYSSRSYCCGCKEKIEWERRRKK